MYKILSKHFDNKFSFLSQQRPYAAGAGKFRVTQDDKKEYTKEEMNNINIHAQYITDFNLIYEKDGEERLFAIAFLHTSTFYLTRKKNGRLFYNLYVEYRCFIYIFGNYSFQCYRSA